MILVMYETGFLQLVKEGDYDISEIKLKVIDPDQEIKISFNGDKYLFFKQDMNIPTKFLKANYINIRLRTKNKTYTSDHIPAIKYTLLGEKVDEIYPHSIAHILNDNIKLRSEMNELRSRVEEYEDFIKDIQETGDII